MISDSNHVIYTCIAHQLGIDSPDSTILAEFNSADSSLTELAQQCLLHTPSHHTIFSQTFRKQTYTFLLDYPFVYFGIFDHNMIKFDQLKLLDRVKETLNHIIKGDCNLKFTSFCLQTELYPIFRKLMSKSLDFDALLVVSPKKIGPLPPVSSSSKGGKKMLGLPILSSNKFGKCLKNKRMLSNESVSDSKEALVDGNKVDVLDNCDEDVGVGEVKSREIICQNGVCLIGDGHGHGHGGNVGKQKAKKIWRRHVWIVLVLDLAVCLILFGIWLFVCRGFQCIER
ncbi:phytolongin Phyl2.2 [Silene latifolia]|uniref:phytolongin Phyl2.2 n=1 Tax=Silene latifolia TaxID=37657 RepID=UPI003D784610